MQVFYSDKNASTAVYTYTTENYLETGIHVPCTRQVSAEYMKMLVGA